MAITQYLTATTLDGFIADTDNSLQWLFDVPHGDDDDGGDGGRWDEFIGGVGAMAMGATTYEWVLDHEELLANPQRWQAMYGDRPCWVFTHRDLPPIPGADIRFVQGDVALVHAQMVAAAAGRNVWLVGGGELVGLFHDAGLLDEIHLGVTPVLLGAGAPLLPRRIEGMQLRSVHQRGPRLDLVYELPRGRTGSS